MASRKTTSIKKRKQKHAYQLLVRLVDSEPIIWRQISVPGNMTLADLDRIIQAAMGWTNSHLHLFTVGAHVYGSRVFGELLPGLAQLAQLGPLGKAQVIRTEPWSVTKEISQHGQQRRFATVVRANKNRSFFIKVEPCARKASKIANLDAGQADRRGDV